MKNLELKSWDGLGTATVNDALNMCPENSQESLFLRMFAQMVRQEMMNDFTKNMENLAYFSHTQIILKDK